MFKVLLIVWREPLGWSVHYMAHWLKIWRSEEKLYMEVPLIFSFNVHNWSKEDKEVRGKVFKQTFSFLYRLLILWRFYWLWIMTYKWTSIYAILSLSVPSKYTDITDEGKVCNFSIGVFLASIVTSHITTDTTHLTKIIVMGYHFQIFLWYSDSPLQSKPMQRESRLRHQQKLLWSASWQVSITYMCTR